MKRPLKSWNVSTFYGKIISLSPGGGMNSMVQTKSRVQKKTSPIVNICEMISFEEFLGEINRVEKQPNIDEEIGFLFFPPDVNDMTRFGRHYQIPSLQPSASNKRKGDDNLPMPEIALEERNILD